MIFNDGSNYFSSDFTTHRYGLPFVSPNNILVTIINGTGAGIEIIYVFIFIYFAPKKEKAKILGLFSFVVAVFSVVVLVSLFALHGNARKLFCGFAAAIFSIIMYGSPLSIMVSLAHTFYVNINSFVSIPHSQTPLVCHYGIANLPLSFHFPPFLFCYVTFQIVFSVNHNFRSVRCYSCLIGFYSFFNHSFS